jgi:N-succinyldiaminopimelate aminotransferase
MPRPPAPASAVEEIPGAIFSRLAHRIAALGDDVFPLHVGDTWMEPFEGARMESLSVRDFPGMHRYGDTQGLSPLVDAIVEKVRSRNRIPCERANVLVTAGATGALGAAVGMLAAPGEEVLVTAPFWPLIRGVVQAFRAAPVEVPFYDRAFTPEEAVRALRDRTGPRTVAVYLSTPSNPTGRVLGADVLEAIADFARREELWILSDEVYEDYVYAGEHVSIGRFAPERTLSAFSFSKAYGMAGNRCGYLVGPAAAVAQARKVSTHTFYAAPTASQLAAQRALEGGAPWVARARDLYRAAGEDAARVLGLPAPAGSCFLFFDVAPQLGEGDVHAFLERCLDDGIALAPGASCGRDYPTWVRICFTAAEPARVAEAVRRLAKRLGR